jgi:hypothetical protein
MSTEEQALDPVSQTEVWLATITTPKRGKQEVDQLALTLEAVKRARGSQVTQNRWALAKLLAKRQTGALLKALERDAGRPKKPGQAGRLLSPYQEALAEAGLDDRLARRWQELTDVSADWLRDLETSCSYHEPQPEEFTEALVWRALRGDEEPAAAEPEWTDEELALQACVERGESIVLNMHTHHALQAWARATDRFVRIDRVSPWGNPFEVDKDGTRDEVVANYREFYFPNKPSLLQRLEELEGKALGCWCAPALCHGNVLLEELAQWYRDRGD